VKVNQVRSLRKEKTTRRQYASRAPCDAGIPRKRARKSCVAKKCHKSGNAGKTFAIKGDDGKTTRARARAVTHDAEVINFDGSALLLNYCAFKTIHRRPSEALRIVRSEDSACTVRELNNSKSLCDFFVECLPSNRYISAFMAPLTRR
jgi:hypothetical protein